ncbi:MAG: MarR family winged helix-turn-helix transcriptional regulator [Desulfuromusa sp.]
MTTFDPHNSLGFQCEITLKAFIRSLSQRLDGTGISPRQFRVLAHLMADGVQTQTELCELLSISPPSMVKLIDRMERDGWVVRKADKSDRRVNKVVCTIQADKIWEDATIHSINLLEQAYRGIDPSEIDSAIRLLTHIRKNLETPKND